GVRAAGGVRGNQCGLGLRGRLAGVGEPAAIDALNQASSVQLVEPGVGSGPEFRFRHPLIRDAIVSDLRPPDRAARSGRAAAAIELAHPDLPGYWCQLALDMYE